VKQRYRSQLGRVVLLGLAGLILWAGIRTIILAEQIARYGLANIKLTCPCGGIPRVGDGVILIVLAILIVIFSL
jgi:fumarate reductase subunit D